MMRIKHWLRISSSRYRLNDISIPKVLRHNLKYNRKLLTNLFHCATHKLEVFFRPALDLPMDEFSAVMGIQTFSITGKQR